MSRAFVLAAASLCIALVSAPLHSQQAERPAAAVTGFEDPTLEWGPCPDFLPAGCAIAVLQGDPTQPNADIFFRVPGGANIVRHWHTSAERMVLVSGELHVDYDGQDTARLRQGSYAFGPPRLPHAAKCVSRGPCVLAIAFEAPVDAFEGEPVQD